MSARSDAERRTHLQAFATACRMLHALDGPRADPELLTRADEAERLARYGWDAASLQELTVAVPVGHVPDAKEEDARGGLTPDQLRRRALAAEVLALALEVRVVADRP